MAINKKELSEAGVQFYPETHIEAVIDGNGNTLDTLLSDKQDALVSGTNIKTVNNTSLVGSGNVSVGTYSKPSTGIPKTDLASEVQTSLGKADSALQSYTETDPTVPSWAKASSKPSYNFSEIGSKPTTISGYGITDAKIASGTITLGSNTITPLTSFTETDPVFSASAAAGISSSDISSWNGKQDTISDLSTIRSGAEAGATAYQLPSTGIPKTDLASAVQTSLGKADTALQSFTETDPVFSASAAAGISSSDITNWNGKTSNIGTITSVKMNGSTVSSSGEADLGTVITSHQDISGKADKVSSATSGNFAGLDANGNLTDSGSKASDFLTQHQSLAGYWNNTNSGSTSYDWAAKDLIVNGKAGFGTASPSYIFHAYGLADGSATWLGAFLTRRSGVFLADGSGNGMKVTSIRNTSSYKLLSCMTGTAADGSGGTEVFTLRADGNAGFGMTSPPDRLSVSGNISATGTITPGSDSRIKDNQEEITTEKAFEVLEKLNPKSWTWNKDAGENLVGKKAAGLVAQEVKVVLPDAVIAFNNDKLDDFHALNYNTVQGYEIAAIKGLIGENKTLKSEVAELKEKLNAIMEMLK